MDRGLVPFRTAFLYWLRLGFINFGGPAGQIAIMHDELVVKRRWISDNRFLHALNYCMLLPGPEAQQLAIYIGWLLNGTWGGIAAGILFILPAFFLIMGLSWTYVAHGDIEWVAAIFYGLRAAVIALVLAAVIRIGAKAIRNPLLAFVAVAAFISVFLLGIPFPLIVLGACGIGFLASKWSPDSVALLSEGAPEENEDVLIADHHAQGGSRGNSLSVLVIGLAVWWLPLLAIAAWRGGDDTLTKEAFFFSQAAMVTFGGAYAVLSYIDQAAVENFGWLQPGQMVTGLGLAESTPGPLIMVTQFVGFLAAYRFPGDLHPVAAGLLGGSVAVWATFAPCFLWIFLGAPYIEKLRGNQVLYAALAAVTAAVVGVICNLAVTFGLATLFDQVGSGRLIGLSIPVPRFASVDLFAVGLATSALIAVIRFRLNVLWVIGGCALAGLFYRAVV